MKGRIQQWNDDKGYGFIQIENSNKRIFVHISAFTQKQPRPEIGEKVSFDTVTNSEGKMAAKNVRYLARQNTNQKSHNQKKGNKHQVKKTKK